MAPSTPDKHLPTPWLSIDPLDDPVKPLGSISPTLRNLVITENTLHV